MATIKLMCAFHNDNASGVTAFRCVVQIVVLYNVLSIVYTEYNVYT